ncbi:MAG: hypothetical protein CMH52_03255 [Myxococcales bacterium]|nr:hypothetical protein [Myxococcales bacterium]
MTHAHIFLVVLCTTACMAACQEHAEFALTPAQQKKVDEHIFVEAPSPQNRLDVIIEDQVKLVGYDLDKTRVKAGESFTITYYLEALAEQMADNNMFVHFQGKRGNRNAWMNLDHNPVEGLLPLRKLKKGQVVKDTQKVLVKADFPSGKASIYWGLFRGNYRLKVSNVGTTKTDREGRVVVANLTVIGAKPKPKPVARAAKMSAAEGIRLDGKLDEPVWKRARWTAWWTHPSGKKTKAPKTRAKFAWDEDNLYVGVESIDDDVWGTLTKRDSNTWEQEVIELFIDADGDKKDYLELQVTPANVVFDAKFSRHRSPLGPARGWNMTGLKTAVHVDGTLNKRDDKDRRWTVEMLIPAAEVPGAKHPIDAGHSWKANLFRFDWPKAQKRQSAASFSPPIVPDFHSLDAFGTIKFQGKKPAIKLGKPGKGLIRTFKETLPKRPIPTLRPSSGPPPKSTQKTNKTQ